ncbi:MAG: hypothetical protein ACM3XR_06045 [Bacillota bacterium]
MVKRHYENQNGDGSSTQKNSNRHQKPEQHGRIANYQNNNRIQRSESQNIQKKAFELHSRDSGQQRGYSREKGRETESQPRHSGYSGRHQGNYKNRSEETIDDIKQDIIRLEKEIELEIKEIRSLKL